VLFGRLLETTSLATPRSTSSSPEARQALIRERIAKIFARMAFRHGLAGGGRGAHASHTGQRPVGGLPDSVLVVISRTSTVLFGRLLEITSLAHTAIDLQLSHSAAARTEDIEVARAFEALRGAT
jgi:hypothetical protein